MTGSAGRQGGPARRRDDSTQARAAQMHKLSLAGHGVTWKSRPRGQDPSNHQAESVCCQLPAHARADQPGKPAWHACAGGTRLPTPEEMELLLDQFVFIAEYLQ